MRSLVMPLVAALVLSGCTVLPTSTTAEVERAPSIVPAMRLPPESPDDGRVTRPTRDQTAPNVTKDGVPSHALAVLVRETWYEDDEEIEHHPCGGALLAANVGWRDPRPFLSSFEYLSSATVVDETGRAWTTDTYVTGELRDRFLWVQNIGGGSRFEPDQGAHCDAPEYERGPLNILMHVEGPSEVDVWFSAAGRPHQSGPSPS